jgi:DNA-binding beta-propeller fold protein YncE
MTVRILSRLGAGIFATLAPALAFAADAPPTYAMTGAVALGVPDRWDYLTFDTHARRVYVSHGNEITVVDGVNGKIVGHVVDQTGSHGSAVATELKRGIADSAANKTVTLFDPVTYKALGTAPAGDDADGIAYDAGSGRAFVANGDAATVTAIDMASGKLAGTVALGTKPEFLVADGAGHLYVNGESTREIVRVDAKKLTVTARFPIPDCESPHGIAMDAVTQRLFTSCSNAKLFVVDADSGKIVSAIAIGKGSDAVQFDPKRKLVFSSNGEGTLSVIAEKSADDFELLGNVPTIRGARTMAVDPANGRVFLVSADIDRIDPPKAPSTRPRVVYKAGSVKLYMFDPVK